MKIPVQYAARFDVASDVAATFELLADVPRSASHFPDVKKVVPLGDNDFRWDMKPISVASLTHQVVYACRYINDDDRHGLSWTPLDNVGNSLISGRWRLQETADGTTLDFKTSGKLDVPVPKLLGRAAKPVVLRRFESMVAGYHENLRRALGSA